MTNSELLQKVVEGLGYSSDYQNPALLPKVLAVKGYMKNAGVSDAQLESDLGIAALTVGVNDLWNLSSGEVKFSEAFAVILLPQLMTVSLGEESN